MSEMRLIFGLTLILGGIIATASPEIVYNFGCKLRKKPDADLPVHCKDWITTWGSICILIGIMACIAHFVA